MDGEHSPSGVEGDPGLATRPPQEEAAEDQHDQLPEAATQEEVPPVGREVAADEGALKTPAPDEPTEQGEEDYDPDVDNKTVPDSPSQREEADYDRSKRGDRGLQHRRR